MPLRDHVRSPLDDYASWEELHGGWPMEIVRSLSGKLPPEYVAAPRVHHGAFIEVDVTTFERGDVALRWSTGNGGQVATAVWAPPALTRAFEDLVTSREFNLYASLMELLGQPGSVNGTAPSQYAVACRYRSWNDHWRLEAWEEPLTLGGPLPVLPLWLADGVALALDLEESYEETCRVLRIP
jgi:hypothetical protein